MISFNKGKFLLGVRVLIAVLASVGLFCLAPPVIAQGSLAPLNPDFIKYLQRLESSGVPEITEDGFPHGFIPPPLDLSHLAGQPFFQLDEWVSAPSYYDLRTLGKVTPVKNQDGCGSCWAFATYGSLESNLLPSETWDFSENNLKNTHGFDLGHCRGGNPEMATAYMARWSGPVRETDDPYNPSSNESPSGRTVRKHLQEALNIPARVDPLDNESIKQAIMAHGALTTHMYSNSTYYNPTYKSYYYNGSPHYYNHVVAIVGWDDNFDRYKFSFIPPGDGAFIAKNSHGTDWGENGFFYVSYYDTSPIGKYNYVFNGSKPTTYYNRIYQYDPLGWLSSYGYGSNTAWFANIFTASASEGLSAVSFYTASLNSSYELYIYTNVTSSPTTGSLSLSQAGTIASAYYHTISLNYLVPLTSGQKFSIVVKLTTPGYNWPIPIEIPITGYSSQAKANPGESYVSSNGSSWADLTSISGYRESNVCLKAFTDSTPPTPNPMTWATPPYQNGTTSISMGANIATDPTVPVTYYFDFVSSPTEGTGGADSNWQSGTTYINSGLQANHQYGYQVKAKDGANYETAYSTPIRYVYTAIEESAGITLGAVTSSSIQVQSTNTPSGLSRGSSGLLIQNTTKGTNSGWKRDNNFWTSGSLSPNKSYSFRAKTRNGNSVETGYSSTVSRYTLAKPPVAASFSNVTPNCIRANWTANGNPGTTQYYCENTTNGTNSGWTTNPLYWDSCGLDCGVSYSFRVKAINGDGIETGWTSLGSRSTVVCPPPPAPTNVQASDGTYTDKVQVSWTASPEADSYTVYRATSTRATKKALGTTPTTTYEDTTASVVVNYYYYVKASNIYGTSGYSASNKGYRSDGRPPAPTNVQASDSLLDKVQVSWEASPRAELYTVYRATSASRWATKKALGTTSTTTYDDTTASVAKTYYYYVKASNSYGTSGYSAYDKGNR